MKEHFCGCLSRCWGGSADLSGVCRALPRPDEPAPAAEEPEGVIQDERQIEMTEQVCNCISWCWRDERKDLIEICRKLPHPDEPEPVQPEPVQPVPVQPPAIETDWKMECEGLQARLSAAEENLKIARCQYADRVQQHEETIRSMQVIADKWRRADTDRVIIQRKVYELFDFVCVRTER